MTRVSRVLIFLFILTSLCAATTKFRLHNSPSSIAGYKTLSVALGPLNVDVQTSVTNSAASGTDIQATATAGGTALAWISEPVSTGFTLSGTITGNPYVKESDASANASIRFRIYKYSGGSEGAAIGVCEAAAEATTSITVKGCTATPTSTAFSAGDRLVVKMFLENCSATSGCPTGTMGGSQTVTVDYDGGTDATDGSTWLQINETVATTADGGTGGTPSIVQLQACDATHSNLITAGGIYTCPLPMQSQAGNFIFVAFASADFGNQANWTVSDNIGTNVWSKGPLCEDGNGVTSYTFYTENSAAGIQKINVNLGGGNDRGQAMGMVAELTNIALSASLDGNNCNFATGTSITAGSVTPNYSGDAVIQYTQNSFVVGTASYTKGSQANITWAKRVSMKSIGQAMQFGVYSSTSALNPTMTQGTSNDWISNTVFLRSSTAGASPTGMYIASAVSQDLLAGAANPTVMDCPTVGNLRVLAYSSGSGSDLTSATDTESNTYTQTAAFFQPNGDSGEHNYYAANATPNTDSAVTLNFNNTTGDATVKCFDIVGAATAPFQSNHVSASGNAASAGNITTTTITPNKTGSILIWNMGIQETSSNGLTGTNQNHISCFYTGEPQPNGCDENNGWGTYKTPNTSAVTFTSTFADAIAVQLWSAITDEFEPPSAAVIKKRVIVIQ